MAFSPQGSPWVAIHLWWAEGAHSGVGVDTLQGGSWPCMSWAYGPAAPNPHAEENLERPPSKPPSS